MKSNKVKRLLAVALAAAMMMATALTAAASGGSGGSSGSTGASTASPASASADASTESAAPEIKTSSAGAKVSVAGMTVTTTVAGVYLAKSVQGVAVITPVNTLKASLGLTGSQTPYIVVFDTDSKKSNKAIACVDAAATALGGTVVTTLNIDLAAKNNGKVVKLANGSAAMVTGLPKGADMTKTYYVVCVQPGGVITILEDQDASPATVTFEIKAGLGTYGIVAR